MRTPRNPAIVLLILLTLSHSLWADEIFIRNQPYKGPARGVGGDLSFSLSHFAQALGVEAVEEEQGWTLAGLSVPTLDQDGLVWVRLADLPGELVRVERSAALQTLDIYLTAATQEDQGLPDWAIQHTLVFFGGIDCEACSAMGPAVGDFQSTGRMKLVYVDIDQPQSDSFRKYVKHFSGNKIPYFVVLDERGKEKHSFAGFRTYKGLLEELKPFY